MRPAKSRKSMCPGLNTYQRGWQRKSWPRSEVREGSQRDYHRGQEKGVPKRSVTCCLSTGCEATEWWPWNHWLGVGSQWQETAVRERLAGCARAQRRQSTAVGRRPHHSPLADQAKPYLLTTRSLKATPSSQPFLPQGLYPMAVVFLSPFHITLSHWKRGGTWYHTHNFGTLTENPKHTELSILCFQFKVTLQHKNHFNTVVK